MGAATADFPDAAAPHPLNTATAHKRTATAIKSALLLCTAIPPGGGIHRAGVVPERRLAYSGQTSLSRAQIGAGARNASSSLRVNRGCGSPRVRSCRARSSLPGWKPSGVESWLQERQGCLILLPVSLKVWAHCIGGAFFCQQGTDVRLRIAVTKGQGPISGPMGWCQRARASTTVMSSGCSPPPIQSSTAATTSSAMRGSGRWRFSCTSSISRVSPNSPKSFSGSVTPSL